MSTLTTNRVTLPASGIARATLLQKLSGYVNTQLVYFIAKFGIADLLKANAKSSRLLAQELGMAHETLYRMLRGCVNVGLLIEVAPDSFITTPMAQLLESDRLDSLRDYALLTGEQWYPAWGGLLSGFETEQTPFEVVFGCDYYTYLAQNPSAGTRFNQFMQIKTEQTARALVESYDFTAATEVIDIGGGNGTLLQILLATYPHLQGILYDMPSVIAEAQQASALQTFGARYRFVSGSFMQTLPTGGDLYLLSQILHNWNDEQCLQILGKCASAMPPHGKLLILEQILPTHLEGYTPVVDYDLMMLVLFKGRERNAAAYEALLNTANLKMTAIYPLKRLEFSVIEAQKQA